ncbi:hypothetical protein H5410_046151 [Solanum commersonii]|uniref:Uncharacterized protein n=1 Tax=Solanum commersonii TaxID=4109 RepID=A0A9J5XDK5_SOLCO|nr:hypothetical protein H5410_046151 [Solanum commersonii]
MVVTKPSVKHLHRNVGCCPVVGRWFGLEVSVAFQFLCESSYNMYAVILPLSSSARSCFGNEIVTNCDASLDMG